MLNDSDRLFLQATVELLFLHMDGLKIQNARGRGNK